MASSTTNLDLILPVGGENVSRQIINANNVKIDEAVGPVPSGTDLQSQVTALNNKIATKYFTSVNDMVTTLNALSENEQIHFVCNATVSASLTGISSMASGVITKLTSTYADAIWVTNGGADSGTSRINISTSGITVNNINNNTSKSIINTYLGNNITKTYTLNANCHYMITLSYVASGNVSDTRVGIVAVPSSSDKTGTITWLTSVPTGSTISLNGFTLTIAIPSSIWADLAIMKM